MASHVFYWQEFVRGNRNAFLGMMQKGLHGLPCLLLVFAVYQGGLNGAKPLAPLKPLRSPTFGVHHAFRPCSFQGAFRSFRNLNRRGLQPLVSVDAFADAIRATGASPLTYPWNPSGASSIRLWVLKVNIFTFISEPLHPKECCEGVHILSWFR